MIQSLFSLILITRRACLLYLNCVPSTSGPRYQVLLPQHSSAFPHLAVDVVGRRPVIFFGIIGLAITTLMFGLSKSLASVLVARCLGGEYSIRTIPELISNAVGGLFSGNVAVIHSVLGEITDSTNQMVAFPIYGLTWPLGSIIGCAPYLYLIRISTLIMRPFIDHLLAERSLTQP